MLTECQLKKYVLMNYDKHNSSLFIEEFLQNIGENGVSM